MTNEFLAVFGEVCRDDYYGVRSLPFVPDVIFDLGANIGVFTTFARFLFPSAQVVAVEPDPRAYGLLMQYTGHFPRVAHIQKALGTGGPVWQGLPPLESPYYGATRSYVTLGQIGFPETEITSPPGQPGRDALPVYEPSTVEPVTLTELLCRWVGPNDNLFIKMDCEGGENSIFTHEPSMTALRWADCLTMETHFYTKGTGTEHEANAQAIVDGLMSLSDTHDCLHEPERRYFRAVRRPLCPSG